MQTTRYSCQILIGIEFSRQSKNPQTLISIKMSLVKAELFHENGQTDGHKKGSTKGQTQRSH